MPEHNLHVPKAPKSPLELAGAAASDGVSGYVTTSEPGFFGTTIFTRGNKVRVTFMRDGDATAEAIPIGSPPDTPRTICHHRFHNRLVICQCHKPIWDFSV